MILDLCVEGMGKKKKGMQLFGHPPFFVNHIFRAMLFGEFALI